MRKLLTTIILVLLTQQVVAQSAWVQKKGKGFFKLNEAAIVSDQFFNPNGDIIDIRTAGVYISSLYGEYGISDKVTAYTYIPFFFRNTLNRERQVNAGVTIPGDESNSIGDSNIGIVYGIKQEGSLVLSASLEFGIPIGETQGGRTQLLASGDGEFNQLIKVHAGYSFYPKPFYAIASLGFNNRTENFSDEFHAGFEFGYTPSPKLAASLKLYNISSLNNGGVFVSQNGLFSNNLEFLSIGPEVNYSISDKFGLSVGLFGAFSGQNILASPSYNAGVFYKF